MSKVDTYSPEIGFYGETGGIPVLNPANEGGRQDRSPRNNNNGTSDNNGNKKPRGGKSPQTSASIKRSVKSAPDPSPISERIKSVFQNTTFRVLTGLFLLFFATYLLISLISFVRDGFTDQALITNTAGVHVNNYGGEGGARLSKVLVDDGFGLGSIIIIFWMIMLSLKLLTNSRVGKFKTLNFTIKCLIAIVTLSLILGLLTIGLDFPFNPGGAHGRFVNQVIIDYIGWAGAALLSLFMLVLFVVICLNDLIQWIIRKKRQHDTRKAALRAEEEAEAARRRELEETQKREWAEEVKAGEHIGDEVADSTFDLPDNVAFRNEAAAAADSISPEEEEMTYIYDDGEEQEAADGRNMPQADASAQENVDKDSAEGNSGASENEAAKDAPMVMKVNVNHIATAEGADSQLPEVVERYHFPPVELLHPAAERNALDRNEQLENKEKIRRTLLDFGIPITDIEATVGPTVTLYEIIPEPGIKISSIRNLADDIARSLRAVGVRIIAPIPGKGSVGIEVANKDPQIVSMRTVITSRKFQECKYELPIALGSTINNEVYIADLTKMPHLLVAGATGQGKSVGLNAIITSLLFRKHPSELKFVLVDPKMVELSLYSAIEKHYLARMPGEDDAIITDVSAKVIPALNSLCVEMDDRYQLLKAARVRAIKEYNQKFLAGELRSDEGHRFMPYIVVVVDEYSDLVMTAGKEIEKPIARLAQKARAIGIHLIVATQRPSTDVVTGMIKANFPARIAFKVSSGVDSKTILNTTEAQQLIGRGDMLIANGSELVRVQCAFIDTPEVEDICTFISQQPCNDEPYILPEPQMGDGSEAGGEGMGDQPIDPLLKEVARTIINLDQASTSGIQRRFNIGYNRAGRIMDQLERLGVVGPSHGGKPRSVLVDPMALENILSTLNV